MLVVEDSRFCSQCGTVTPHSRRRLAVPKIAAGTLWGTGAWLCWTGGMRILLGVGLLFLGLLALLLDRERFWRVPCERCRTHRRAALRRTKPTLDGRTEISFFSF